MNITESAEAIRVGGRKLSQVVKVTKNKKYDSFGMPQGQPRVVFNSLRTPKEKWPIAFNQTFSETIGSDNSCDELGGAPEMPPRTAFNNTARVSDIFYPITPNANMDQTIKSSEIDLAESTIEKHQDTLDMTTQAQLFGAGTSIFDSSKIEKKSRYIEDGQVNEHFSPGIGKNENVAKHRQSFIEARKNIIDKIQFKDKAVSQFHALPQDGMREMDISFGKARNS